MNNLTDMIAWAIEQNGEGVADDLVVALTDGMKIAGLTPADRHGLVRQIRDGLDEVQRALATEAGLDR